MVGRVGRIVRVVDAIWSADLKWKMWCCFQAVFASEPGLAQEPVAMPVMLKVNALIGLSAKGAVPWSCNKGRKFLKVHPQSLTWNLNMFFFPKGISFSRGWFSGSMLNLRGVPTLFFGSRGWEWNLYRVLKEETFISAVAMKYVPVKFNSQQPLPSVKLRGIWLLRKPKLDVKMSFWVVFMLFIKTVPEWNTYLSLTIFSGVLVQNATGGKPVGITLGVKTPEWLQLMFHEIPWVDDIVFLWKTFKMPCKMAPWKRFFGKRFLYDIWKLPIRSRMVSWNWCCSGQARAWKGLSWMERTGNVHRQLVQKDLSCRVYGFPSREPTYPFPTHFCRLFSFSQSGTCDRSLKGMWWVENFRMEKPSLLMPSCPYFQCYQLKLWDVSVSSLCLAQDLLKGMNCRISLWYTLPETNIFAPENRWYCIFRCELLVSGRVSQKPIKSWYMWKNNQIDQQVWWLADLQ